MMYNNTNVSRNHCLKMYMFWNSHDTSTHKELMMAFDIKLFQKNNAISNKLNLYDV